MVKGLYGGQCAELHHAYICDRGGTRRLAELRDLTQVQWTRVRDEVSECVISLQGAACSSQAELLASIEPKRHELVIFRGDDRVWEGPISRVGWHSDWVEIAAKDVMDYVFGRALSREWSNNYPNVTEVTSRLGTILQYEMSTDYSFIGTGGVAQTIPAWENLTPPANVLPHLTIHHSPNEARTSAKTTPFQMTVGEHVDNMARTAGVDYTVVGRAIHIWDVSSNLGETRTLTEADFFGEVIITAYGSDFASVAFAVASDGRAGGAGKESDYYGPWTKMFTVYDEDETNPPTIEDLVSQAGRNLNGRSPVPIEVRVADNSGIRLSPGLQITDLVPGVRIPLLATLNARRTSQFQKLHKLVVTESADGETIAVTLVPATKEDSDEVIP